jgi:hypothetical protein
MSDPSARRAPGQGLVPAPPRGPLRALAYLWALPATLLGLLLVGVALATRGQVARLRGVLEAHGGWLRPLLARCVPLRRGADALTLGHVIVGQDAGSLARNRAHETAHVRQYERWGPLFLPAYACASLWVLTRGGDPYLDNRFERGLPGLPDVAVRDARRPGARA